MKEIGDRLRAARLEKGLTLKDIQLVLKIRQRYLEAIEAGRLEDLPGAVYARGFIRSYARYLDMDVEEDLKRATSPEEAPLDGVAPGGEDRPPQAATLAPAMEEMPPPRPSPVPPAEKSFAATRSLGLPRMGWPWFVGGAAALAVIIIVLSSGHPAKAPPVTTHKKTGTTTTPPGSTPAAIKDLGAKTVNGYPGEFYSVAKGPVVVTVTATGPCWVRTWADGGAPQDETLSAGTYTFSAQTDLAIVFGFPGNVSVKMNGVFLGQWTGNVPRAVEGRIGTS